MTLYRVGIIGLTPIDPGYFSGGQWGIQHLKALKASPNFKITAVCNSTITSAQKSIEAHQLDGAKAHATAEDLAADPNVDLVVICVFIDRHYELMKPALLQKKHVYVEFPVGINAAEVKDLNNLAQAAGVKVVVGAQATPDPLFRMVQTLVATKVVGDITFSSFTSVLTFGADSWPCKMAPALDLESPVSRSKGALGHILAAHSHILGSVKTIQSVFKTVHKTTTTVDDNNQVVEAARTVTAPDTMLLQGVLESGAAFSFTLRSARTTVCDIGSRWIIAGTDGEIEVITAPTLIQFGDLQPKIKLRKWNQEQIEINSEDFGSKEEEWLKKLPSPTANIARAYDYFAKGDETGYINLGEGAKIHELLDRIHETAEWAP